LGSQSRTISPKRPETAYQLGLAATIGHPAIGVMCVMRRIPDARSIDKTPLGVSHGPRFGTLRVPRVQRRKGTAGRPKAADFGHRCKSAAIGYPSDAMGTQSQRVTHGGLSDPYRDRSIPPSRRQIASPTVPEARKPRSALSERRRNAAGAPSRAMCGLLRIMRFARDRWDSPLLMGDQAAPIRSCHEVALERTRLHSRFTVPCRIIAYSLCSGPHEQDRA
jgi:hypothetical protein